MQPVYSKNADPKDRTTWIDKFIALEPRGGARDVVLMARNGHAAAILTMIFGRGSKAGKAA